MRWFIRKTGVFLCVGKQGFPDIFEDVFQIHDNKSRRFSEEFKMITAQLKRIHQLNPKAIFDVTDHKEANKESYFARNASIVKNCDAVYAFQVNESEGVADAMNKARNLGKKVIVKKYTVQFSQ